MRSPIWFKFVLVFSAYLPLFLIIGIKFLDLSMIPTDSFELLPVLKSLFSTPMAFLSTFSFFMLTISFLSCIWVTYVIKDTEKTRAGSKSIRIEKVQSRDGDILSYLVTYVLPLISLNSSTWREVFVLIILIFVTLFLSLRSDLLYVNPLLIFMKFHLYSVETNESEILLISRHSKFNLLNNRNRMCYRLEEELILLDGEIVRRNS